MLQRTSTNLDLKELLSNEKFNKVRKYRKEKSYSTNDLAEKLGVSHGWVNNLENAKTDIFKLELLYKLTQELDISIEELLCIEAVTEKNIVLTTDTELRVLIKILDAQNKKKDIKIDKLKSIIKWPERWSLYH